MLKLATVAARRLAARHHRCMRRLSSKEFDFTVDRTGLGKVGYESSPSAVQAPETPLGLELGSQILARGPLSVYEYMRQCLLHPRHGYYARSGAERNFGAGGDFVTAELAALRASSGSGSSASGCASASRKRPATHAQKPDAETPVTWALDGFGDFGTRATWHESLDEIDDDGVPTLLVGQEVLDAFPAYQFVKTDNGWREKLVDLADAGRTASVRPGAAAAPAPRALAAADAPSLATKDGEAETLEVAPGALAFVDAVAKVSPLREPGLVDLTVDADFGACGDRAAAVDGAARRAVDQGEWLQRMGIVPRLEALLNLDDITESQVEDLISACERLTAARRGARAAARSGAKRRSDEPAVDREAVEGELEDLDAAIRASAALLDAVRPVLERAAAEDAASERARDRADRAYDEAHRRRLLAVRA
ncbi:protein-arginine omega-N symmetric methyltransferase [Aureococcus anophagefferens]|nr:protein-arginine omega-N symmetric methyltransferase [Aureococcus anophagefferens]